MVRNTAREIAIHLSYELSFTGLTAGELLEQFGLCAGHIVKVAHSLFS